MTSFSSPTVEIAKSLGIDAFSRLRISEPFTIFDSKQIFDDPDLANNVENFPLFYDNQETSGSGTSTTFNVNRASTVLTVSANTAGTRIRQSRQWFNYQPGKSQLVAMTAVLGNTPTGITKCLGLFSTNNGVYFRVDGETISVAHRSFVTGGVVAVKVPQSEWNLDKMDGKGASRAILDITKAHIFVIDFQWLGTGVVRFGLFIGTELVYVHQMEHANILASVYMSTPNAPLRAEISNDGTGAESSMEVICASVLSEGGVNPTGAIRGDDIGVAAGDEIQANTIGTTYAICGIRLKSAYLGASVVPVAFSIIETTTGAGAAFLWKLHFEPTLTTGLTYSDVPASAVQFGVGAPAGDAIIDDGYVLGCGYVSGNVEGTTLDVNQIIKLGSLIDGTPDEIVLSVTPAGANQDVLGALMWREYW